MRPEFLLVTDLDGTLLGDDEALQAFRNRLRKSSVRMRLVYASGRLVDDVQTLVLKRHLCAPDAVIGGVGTQISCSDGVPAAWCRPPSTSWNATLVRTLLSDLALQPEPFQSEFKVSYYLNDALPDVLDELSTRLTLAGLEADLIYSSHRDLDVVPHGISKGSAASFLARRWRIPAQRVIVCGDSGNDLSLFQYGFRGVIVSNCRPELRELKGDNIFFASERHAAGVMQGMDYWFAMERASY